MKLHLTSFLLDIIKNRQGEHMEKKTQNRLLHIQREMNITCNGFCWEPLDLGVCR